MACQWLVMCQTVLCVCVCTCHLVKFDTPLSDYTCTWINIGKQSQILCISVHTKAHPVLHTYRSHMCASVKSRVTQYKATRPAILTLHFPVYRDTHGNTCFWANEWGRWQFISNCTQLIKVSINEKHRKNNAIKSTLFCMNLNEDLHVFTKQMAKK